MAFSYEIQKVIEKAQNLRFSEDFVLLMAPAGGLEPLAYCLGVDPIRHREVASNA